jgi:hypothetical protein
MRRQFLISVLFVLFLNSCTDKYDKNLDILLGEWILQEMTYYNEEGKLIVLDKVSSSIIFSSKDLNVNSKENRNFDKLGTLIVDNDSISFVYQFDFNYNTIFIDIRYDSISQKPLYTFGKMYSYNYEIINKNELLFSADNAEYSELSNEKLTNPVYVFERK